jgi:hypothetical protein
MIYYFVVYDWLVYFNQDAHSSTFGSTASGSGGLTSGAYGACSTSDV